MNNADLQRGFEDLLNYPSDIEDCWVERKVTPEERETFGGYIGDTTSDEATQVVNYVTIPVVNEPITTLIKFANGQVARFTYELLAYPERYEDQFRRGDIQHPLESDNID